MRIAEQIQEGQSRANAIIRKIKSDIEDMKKLHIAESTYKEELESKILELFNSQK